MARTKQVITYPPHIQARIDAAKRRVQNVTMVFLDDSAPASTKAQAFSALANIARNLKSEVKADLANHGRYQSLQKQMTVLRAEMVEIESTTPSAMERQQIAASWNGFRKYLEGTAVTADEIAAVPPTLSGELLAEDDEDDTSGE